MASLCVKLIRGNLLKKNNTENNGSYRKYYKVGEEINQLRDVS